MCLITCSIVYYSSKEIQSICFRVYFKTPFAKVSMFFLGDYMSTEDTEKRRKKYLKIDPF